MNISTNTETIEKKTINGMEFVYIGTEKYRDYLVPVDGQTFLVNVENPEWLYVRPSGTHLVIDRAGKAHYIPKFVKLTWENEDKAVPANF